MGIIPEQMRTTDEQTCLAHNHKKSTTVRHGGAAQSSDLDMRGLPPFWLKPFLAQISSCLCCKKSDFGGLLLHLCQPSHGTQRMEHDSSARGVGASCPRATPQVCPVATSIEGREAPVTTSTQSDTAGLLHKHQRQGSGRHTPRRRWP